MFKYKLKWFSVFAMGIAALVLIAWAVCFLIRGGRLGLDTGLATGQGRGSVVFPTAGYLPPKARAARVVADIAEPMHPYALFSPSATNYVGCITALRNLPAELTTEQFEAVRSAMALPFESSMPYSELEFNGLRNAAAEFLLQQPEFPPDLLLDFAAMHVDPAQDAVWRNYCLQMLATGWQNLGGRDDEGADEARAFSVQMLEGVVNTHRHDWAGTALLGLRLISDSDPDAFAPEELNLLILDVARNQATTESTRLTALRLAGERSLIDVQSTAEALALDPVATPMLRLCAVATLGDIGTSREILEIIAANSDSMLLCDVARNALRKMEGSATATHSAAL